MTFELRELVVHAGLLLEKHLQLTINIVEMILRCQIETGQAGPYANRSLELVMNRAMDQD